MMSTQLGPLEILGAAAVGQPGQRRFCLYVQSRRDSAVIWMEKEQLNRLSLTLDQVLAQLTEGQVLRTEAEAGRRPAPAGLPADFLNALNMTTARRRWVSHTMSAMNCSILPLLRWKSCWRWA